MVVHSYKTNKVIEKPLQPRSYIRLLRLRPRLSYVELARRIGVSPRSGIVNIPILKDRALKD